MAGFLAWFLIGLGFVIALIVGVIAIILWIRSYDFKVRIRELTSTDNRLVYDTTGKVVTDKEGVPFLKLFTRQGYHKELPIPPDNAIDYDPSKKKKVIETWWSDEDGYVWVMDKGRVEGLQPFPTNQRILFTHQIKKREAAKKTSWTQHLPAIAGMVVLIIILTVVLLFWGNAMQPMIDIGTQYDGLLEKTDAILEKATLLSGGGQVVTGANPPT